MQLRVFWSKTTPQVMERQIICGSENGTFEDATDNMTAAIGNIVAGFLKTNLYEYVLVEVADKKRITATLYEQHESPEQVKIGVSWRVLFHCYPYEDGKYHEVTL